MQIEITWLRTFQPNFPPLVKQSVTLCTQPNLIIHFCSSFFLPFLGGGETALQAEIFNPDPSALKISSKLKKCENFPNWWRKPKLHEGCTPCESQKKTLCENDKLRFQFRKQELCRHLWLMIHLFINIYQVVCCQLKGCVDQRYKIQGILLLKIPVWQQEFSIQNLSQKWMNYNNKKRYKLTPIPIYTKLL